LPSKSVGFFPRAVTFRNPNEAYYINSIDIAFGLSLDILGEWIGAAIAARFFRGASVTITPGYRRFLCGAQINATGEVR
jgi:hypothetical protein